LKHATTKCQNESHHSHLEVIKVKAEPKTIGTADLNSSTALPWWCC